MFSLLRHKKADPTPILTSTLCDEKSFYGLFAHDLKNCNWSVLIESPYLTVKRANDLAPLFKRLKRRGVSVRINTREPRHHTKRLCSEALDAIKILKKAGVKVYVCSDLRHRKLAIIDGELLWEGSLNILSQSRSREVMRRTQSADMCQQMIRFTGANRLFW
jgi:hypothetical protein